MAISVGFYCHVLLLLLSNVGALGATAPSTTSVPVQAQALVAAPAPYPATPAYLPAYYPPPTGYYQLAAPPAPCPAPYLGAPATASLFGMPHEKHDAALANPVGNVLPTTSEAATGQQPTSVVHGGNASIQKRKFKEFKDVTDDQVCGNRMCYPAC